MSKLNENLPKNIYKLSRCGVATGMSVVFNKAEELCRHNNNFQSSLVVSLLEAAVAKATSPKGSNAKTDIIVLDFIFLSYVTIKRMKLSTIKSVLELLLFGDVDFDTAAFNR